MEPLRLLYIEDDEDIQAIYSEQLKALVDTIVYAQDGEEGYEQYLLSKPHIILLDINMPKLDGLSLAKTIRAIDKEVKIIITTSYADQDKLLEAIELYLVKYILKPVEPRLLQETILKAKNEIVSEVKEKKRTFVLDDNMIWNATDEKLLLMNAEVKLTKNERRLLTLLSTYPNKVYTFFEIFDHLSYDDFYKEYDANQIRALVKLIRKKIPKDSILNVYGEGYRFNPLR